MSVLKQYDAASGLWRTVGGMGLPQTPVSFSAHKNGVNQTGIATGTGTKITFTAIEWSTGGGYDTAQSRFQPSIQGIYLVESNVRFADLNACTIFAHISKNGVSVEQFVSNENAGYNSLKLSKLIHFNGSTDYIEIYAGHYAGSVKSVMGSTNDTFFQACLIPDSYDSTKQIVNLTEATPDYLLGVGETAKITYSGVTSLPLRIKTVEGEYEVIIKSDTATITASTNASLSPNNATYAGLFSRRGVVDYATTVASLNELSQNSLLLCGGLCKKVKLQLSTNTASKNVLVHSVGQDTGNTFHLSAGLLWNDTTTLWESLGTITFPFAQSGTVVIKRIA